MQESSKCQKKLSPFNTTALTEFDQKTTLFETMTKSKSFNKSLKQRALYHALMESILVDEDAMDEGISDKFKKRKLDDAGKHEGPSTGSDRGHVELEYNIKECYKAVTNRLDWNNPKGKEYMFDLSKPLPLIMVRGHQVVPVDYFFNNDLEYPRGGSPSKKYITSTTKTKAAKYDIPGIEDMVLSLWSLVKVAYDRYDFLGTSQWAVTKVKVMKWYDYGYLEENKVRREDQQLYKFNDGDFRRLHLHDIEDMLLLLVQKKLFNLEIDVIFDLGVALWMFTRRIIILKRVEDLQLGVEIYQKKLNINKP
ncbi:hypothetical protein Tco_1157636 [Tanacetum coccineum]